SDPQEIALPHFPKLRVYVSDLHRNADVADIGALETALASMELLDTDLSRDRLEEADSSVAALAEGALRNELDQHLFGKWLEYVVGNLALVTIADLEKIGIRNLESGS